MLLELFIFLYTELLDFFFINVLDILSSIFRVVSYVSYSALNPCFFTSDLYPRVRLTLRKVKERLTYRREN